MRKREEGTRAGLCVPAGANPAKPKRMGASQLILTLLMLASGSLLTAAGAFFSRRRQNKDELNEAVADLLEVHFQLSAYIAIAKAVDEAKLPLPQGAIPQMRKMFMAWFPSDQDIHTRYSTAVTAISRYDPVLGFRLRSRDAVQPFQARIIELQTHPDAPAGFLKNLDLTLAIEGAATLRELLPEIARRSSWRLARRVRRMLEDVAPEMPLQLKEYLAELKTDLQKAPTTPPRG